MSTNYNPEVDFTDALEPERPATNRYASALGDASTKVNDAVSRGIGTLKDQYRVVREQGVQGVTNDVVGYAKREPVKALLLAGGIGALVALILRRR